MLYGKSTIVGDLTRMSCRHSRRRSTWKPVCKRWKSVWISVWVRVDLVSNSHSLCTCEKAAESGGSWGCFRRLFHLHYEGVDGTFPNTRSRGSKHLFINRRPGLRLKSVGSKRFYQDVLSN